MKTRLRLGDAVDDEDILDLYKLCPNGDSRLNLFIGLAVSNKVDLSLELLSRELERKPGSSCAKALFPLVAASMDLGESMIEMYEEESRISGSGLAYIFTNSPAEALSDEQKKVIRKHFQSDNFPAIGELLHQLSSPRHHGWLQTHDATVTLGVLLLWMNLDGE